MSPKTTCKTHARIEPHPHASDTGSDVRWFLYQVVDGERIDLASGSAASVRDAQSRIRAEFEFWNRNADEPCAIDAWEILA